MNKFFKITCVVLTLVLALTLLAACGGGEDAADVKGETQTWGEITLFVPEEYTLKGGDMFGEEAPNRLTLNKGESSFEYIMVGSGYTEDEAASSIDMTRSVNEGCEDIEITAGANTWTGVAYNSLGVDCVSVSAPIGDGYVLITSAGAAKDDAAFNKVLESIVVK